MNYPIWEIPAGGLLIAGIAVFHVFISHFAVGGGLFLVLLERKARNEDDEALLGYVRNHSRFFILVTLVLGAITGVGIWFTIGLVHPQATASLISTFVWGWAIEWTFFVIEIAAAMVYYYGWDRLNARQHLAVGWVYFGAAWMSLVIITGIIGYMLTPGEWITTRQFWDGFFNPSYWPQVVARTFICVGLAGLYALFTVSFSKDRELKSKVARYAGLKWILPMAVALPLSIVWYLAAVSGAGIPISRILGSEAEGFGAVLSAVLSRGAESGYPSAQTGAFYFIVAPLVILVFALAAALWNSGILTPLTTSIAMLVGLLGFGGFEFVRETLRKPFVIGQFMFVNGVRLPAPESVPAPPAEAVGQQRDAFSLVSLNETGVLAASPWDRPSEQPQGSVERHVEEGREVFKLLCSSCHTLGGYQGIEPLVAGKEVAALEGLLGRLAQPVDVAGQPASWNDPQLRLVSWRDRRMPPFVGTEEEKRSLAMYLASLGGADLSQLSVGDAGQEYFEENCSFCHAEGSDFPLQELAADRSAEDFYEQLGGLPEINDMMPPFEGTEEQRRALADFLERFVSSHSGEEGGQQ